MQDSVYTARHLNGCWGGGGLMTLIVVYACLCWVWRMAREWPCLPVVALVQLNIKKIIDGLSFVYFYDICRFQELWLMTLIVVYACLGWVWRMAREWPCLPVFPHQFLWNLISIKINRNSRFVNFWHFRLKELCLYIDLKIRGVKVAEQFVVGLVVCSPEISFEYFGHFLVEYLYIYNLKQIMQLLRNTERKSNAAINTTTKQTKKKTKRDSNQTKTAQKKQMNPQEN